MPARALDAATLRWFLPAVAMAAAAAIRHSSFLACAPALALALLAVSAKRRELARLRKELRAIELPALALLAAPAVAHAAGVDDAAAFLVALLSPMLVAAGLGAELESSTWTAWWLQPRSLRALLLEKLGVAALVIALGFAQLACFARPAQLELPLAAALVALGVAPVITLATRHALAGGLVAFSEASVLVGSFRPVLGENETLFGWAVRPAWQVLALALALGLVGLACALWGLPSLVSKSPQAWPLFTSSRMRARSSAWRALLRKELRLQVATFAVSALGLLLPALFAWGGNANAVAPAAMFFGLVCGALAGICAVGGEHRHGTALADAASAPLATLWRAKVLVAGGVAVAVGVVLPLVEIAALHGLGLLMQESTNHSVEILNPSGITFVAGWMALVVGLAAVGLAVSAFVHDLSRAFVATLAVGAALLALLVTTMTATELGADWAYWKYGPVPHGPLYLILDFKVAEELGLRLSALVVVAATWIACRVVLGEARRSWPAGGFALRWRPFAALLATGVFAGVSIFAIGLVRFYSAMG